MSKCSLSAAFRQTHAHLYQSHSAIPLRSRPACSQLSLGRCPPGMTPTGRKPRENERSEIYRNGCSAKECAPLTLRGTIMESGSMRLLMVTSL